MTYAADMIRSLIAGSLILDAASFIFLVAAVTAFLLVSVVLDFASCSGVLYCC